MRALSLQELEDILVGCTYLGCGGGGSFDQGLEQIRSDYAANETGRALHNPEFERGQAVTVLGFPAPALWRSPRGLQAFGPKYFGFEASYIPIEKQFNRSNQR